jgi:putative aminopeptidase FrvX
LFDLKSHLRALVNAHGPSGHEAPVRALLREAWAELVDEFREDGLGSLIGIPAGAKSRRDGSSHPAGAARAGAWA